MKMFVFDKSICLLICCILQGVYINGQSNLISAPNGYATQRFHGHKPFVVNKSDGNFLKSEIRKVRSVFLLKLNSSEKYIIESYEKPAINNSQLPITRPRFLPSRNINLSLDPSVFQCREKFANSCRNKTTIFGNRIINEFKKSVKEIVNESNYYHVQFKSKFEIKRRRNYQTACMLLDADVKVLRRRDPPFKQHFLGRIFPKRKLFKELKDVKSCAIVSSAGSLVNSKLGKFIDLHDIVMRFNHAPVEGYEEDVGTKTTIRVVNSQVVTKAKFNFINSKIFQNITIAAWDPGKYNGSLKDWLSSADFDIFTNYEIYRKKYPKSSAYLIDPHTIWGLWEKLQDFTKTPIRRNPPSSGFIGLALLLPYCPYVDFIEYIPSTRLNGRCHYYGSEINAACTFGAWHPLAAEKLMTLKMNIADDFAVFQNGIVRVRRPDKYNCDSRGVNY